MDVGPLRALKFGVLPFLPQGNKKDHRMLGCSELPTPPPPGLGAGVRNHVFKPNSKVLQQTLTSPIAILKLGPKFLGMSPIEN